MSSTPDMCKPPYMQGAYTIRLCRPELKAVSQGAFLSEETCFEVQPCNEHSRQKEKSLC